MPTAQTIKRREYQARRYREQLRNDPVYVERQRAYGLKWAREKRQNDPEWRARRNKCSRNYCKRHPERTLIAGARTRAEQKGIPFSLTEHDITIPAVCPVFGTPLFMGKFDTPLNSPSIDRIIPELGYVPGNVRVISLRANRLRNDATADELFKVAQYAADCEKPRA